MVNKRNQKGVRILIITVLSRWDSGSNVGEFDGHSRRVLSCAFKPTRPFRIVSCGEDLLVNFYEGPPFKLKQSHRDHSNFVNCVRFSPDGSKFVTVSSDKQGLLYDGKNAEKKGELSSEDAHKGLSIRLNVRRRQAGQTTRWHNHLDPAIKKAAWSNTRYLRFRFEQNRCTNRRSLDLLPIGDTKKPDREDELLRIEEQDGKLIHWNGARVFGVLAMSRAIVRLAPEEISNNLTGYEHNGVTCVGMKTDVPVIAKSFPQDYLSKGKARHSGIVSTRLFESVNKFCIFVHIFSSGILTYTK